MTGFGYFAGALRARGGMLMSEVGGTVGGFWGCAARGGARDAGAAGPGDPRRPRTHFASGPDGLPMHQMHQRLAGTGAGERPRETPFTSSMTARDAKYIARSQRFSWPRIGEV